MVLLSAGDQLCHVLVPHDNGDVVGEGEQADIVGGTRARQSFSVGVVAYWRQRRSLWKSGGDVG